MTKDTTSKLTKPQKPYPDFPLFAHATRRWAKKIRGQMHYFGPWSDWQAALAKYQEQRDDLHAGRSPRIATDQNTVRDVVNHFLTAKEAARDRGDLTARSHRDYFDTCKRIIDTLGKNPIAQSLSPTDFAKLLDVFKGWAPVTRANEIQRVRTVFTYAWKAQLIDRPLVFGPEFVKPPAKVIRAYKAAKPERLFSREEILGLLKRANVQLEAMILLGVNCGLGNTDISELNWSHLDLKQGFMDYHRPKTAMDRNAALWPETVKALKAVKKYSDDILTTGENKSQKRCMANDAEDADAVFITWQGFRFVRQGEKSNRDSVAVAFNKLMEAEGIDRAGVGFYSLRHVFETQASNAGDQATVDRCMGHAEGHVRGNYQHWEKNETGFKRLRNVGEHLRRWLYGKKVGPDKIAGLRS